MKTLAIVGTFDTKAPEFSYVRDLAKELGLGVFMIHVGAFDAPYPVDVGNAEVFKAAGQDIGEIQRKKDRATATLAAAQGLEALLPRLFKDGKFDGVLSLGGSGGTSIATPAMRALPIGVPKVVVSTMASGNTAQYVGTSDVILIPSIVDVAGLNAISTAIFKNAVTTVAGMLLLSEKLKVSTGDKKPTVAATMFGVTTPCVNQAKEVLEKQGYEVLVFHATGTGGMTMESLIEGGFIDGVLDLTTTEWCDEIVGGVLAAGEHRCEAAAKNHVPQVVSVGALDMVNFGPWDTVPPQFAGRNLYKHNPTVTLMRTSVEENRQIAEKLAEKLNMASGKTALFLPLKGVSMIDAEGQPFYGPEEDKMLFDTLRAKVDKKAVEIVEFDNNINDEAFSVAAAEKLIALMKK
jgi:uncharacterized protein (UPF0261 family)